MTEMEKPKIKSIISKEFNKRKAHFFLIAISEGLHKALISLFIKLGFKYKELVELDTEYENQEIFIFVNKRDLSGYVINGPTKNEILLIIEGFIEKEDLINKIEEEFQIF